MRLSVLATFLVVFISSPVLAKTAMHKDEVIYKRADDQFYLRADVLKALPGTVFVSSDNFNKKGDDYLVKFLKIKKADAPLNVYVLSENDWLEPVTPPDMPATLGVAVDQMQIREPHGDVSVALPADLTKFSPATDGETIPNGADVKIGQDSSAAVLLGGVNSVRLVQDSEAVIDQIVTATFRKTEVDLKSGAAFAKVGTVPGVQQDFKVSTTFGVAAAKGTDFVTLKLLDRMDVWVAQGKVELSDPVGKVIGLVSSLGSGRLQLIRTPVLTDAQQILLADAATMSMALNLIPTINLKVKALRQAEDAGNKLTERERNYLGRIKRVPSLIKLELAEPPPIPPAKPTMTDTPMTNAAPMTPMASVTPMAPMAPTVPSSAASPTPLKTTPAMTPRMEAPSLEPPPADATSGTNTPPVHAPTAP